MATGKDMTFKKLNGVLSFQRGIILTDGLMYNILENGRKVPIEVIRHGIRGINNKEVQEGKDASPSNVQRTESAKTSPDAVGIAVEFYVRILPIKNTIFNCALDEKNWRSTFDAFIEYHCQDKAALTELSCRYARNILSGRWLWRNQFLSDDITVSVGVSGKPGAEFTEVCKVGCSTVEQGKFGNYSQEETDLGRKFLECFLGQSSFNFKVEARVMFGFKGVIEVFPSQNFAPGKPKGFARPLYKVNPISQRDLRELSPKGKESAGEYFGDTIKMGSAALRDQKIGNAIRTIDTWWSGDDSAFPIPVEPNGACLSTNDFKRNGRSKNTWVHYLGCMADLHSDSPEARYLLAMFVRGGVHGEKDKESE